MNGASVSSPRNSDDLLRVVDACLPALILQEVPPSFGYVWECEIVEHDECIVSGVDFCDSGVLQRSLAVVVAVYEYHGPFQRRERRVDLSLWRECGFGDERGDGGG